MAVDLSKYKKATTTPGIIGDLSKYKKQQPNPLGSAAGAVYGATKDVATGVSKGATKTFLGIGEVGQKIQGAVGKGIDWLTGGYTKLGDTAKGGIFDPTSAAGAKAREIVTPKGLGENLGFGVEQAAEYFIPAGGASKAEKIVTTASKALPGILAPATRIAGKALAQGAPAAGIKFLQSGGDADAALTTGALTGGLRAGMAVVGEGARALHLPEKLYTTVFKNTKTDMLKEIKSNGVENIKKTDPELFELLVKEGAIKTSKGQPIINETLAEEALARGLKGSTKTMADAVVKGTLKSEIAARKAAESYKGTVDLPEEQFQNVLKGLADEYEDVGFGEISKKANELATTLVETKGKLSATQALEVRRFLDKMRVAKSFDSPASKLSLSQANLKTLTDTVRGRVNAIPEMGAAMKNYSFYIDALEALAKEAARRGNNQVVGMIDSILFGTATAVGSPALGAFAALRRVAASPGGATAVGSALDKGTVSPALGGLMGAGSAAITPD